MDANGRDARKLGPGEAPAWSPDGRQIAYLRDGSIWIMNAADGSGARRLTRRANTGNSNGPPRWTPDGRRIVYEDDSLNASEIRALDLATGVVKTVVAQGSSPAVSPDGRRLVYEFAERLYVKPLPPP
jgi:TolB protein